MTEPGRHFPLAGADNFRDLGGYATSDGRTVAWGRLFRSGHLGELTDADVAAVERLGIRLICDLRAPAERVDLESRLPATAPPRVVSIPVDFPALIHCNGGKDRTGFASMLVLLALGVPRTTIVADYLLTNHLTRRTTIRRAWLVFLASRLAVRPSEMRALLEAREPYLDAAFDTMERQHGSTDAYLREALGVDDALRDKLRAAFLV
jgi:protein-tyrosine phosphatase